MKRKIRNIKSDDSWDNVKFKIMRDTLLGTIGFLYKATKDPDFACGPMLSEARKIDQTSLTGENMCGKSSTSIKMNGWELKCKYGA